MLVRPTQKIITCQNAQHSLFGSVCAFIIIYFNLSVGSSHIGLGDFKNYFWDHVDTKQTF